MIVERTRTLDGLAAARRAGKKLDRPLGKHAPAPERVAALRAAGRSWPAIARRLRCPVGFVTVASCSIDVAGVPAKMLVK